MSVCVCMLSFFLLMGRDTAGYFSAKTFCVWEGDILGSGVPSMRSWLSMVRCQRSIDRGFGGWPCCCCCVADILNRQFTSLGDMRVHGGNEDSRLVQSLAELWEVCRPHTSCRGEGDTFLVCFPLTFFDHAILFFS